MRLRTRVRGKSEGASKGRLLVGGTNGGGRKSHEQPEGDDDATPRSVGVFPRLEQC